MKIFGTIIILFAISFSTLFGQETTEKKKERPVRSPYESGVLIDNQTMVIPTAKTLEMVIEHRFGTMNNGIEDFFGIWAPTNIRLGLNYSLTDYLWVGVGTSKNYRLQDLRWKWNIIQQTRSGSIPLTVTYYGNFAIDAREKENFGENYKFTNRFSYFTQVIVTRKFCDAFTFQIAGSFAHINKIDQPKEHDKIGIHFAGRVRVSPQSSILFNYDIPINTDLIGEHIPLEYKPKHNMGIAWEVSTSTHAFQITLGTANFLNPQYNLLFNENDWTKGEIMLGINITRLWSF